MDTTGTTDSLHLENATEETFSWTEARDVMTPGGAQQGVPGTIAPSILSAMSILNLYVEGVILYGGIVGNVMVVLIFSQRHFKKTIWNTYIRFLAVVDFLLLAIVLQTHWVNYNFRPGGKELLLCKVMLSAAAMLSGTEAWIIVALTVDRLLCVGFPFVARKLATKSLLKQAMPIVFIVAISLVKNIHTFLKAGFALDAHSLTMTCTLIYETKDAVDQALPWVDLLYDSLLPFFLLLFLNIAVIVFLVSAVKKRKRMSKMPNGNQQLNNTQAVAQLKAQRIAVMLLVISMVFLLLTCPRRAFILLYGEFFTGNSPAQRGLFLLTHTITHKLWHLNSAINFLLYCATAPHFRQALCKTLGCRKNADTINDENGALEGIQNRPKSGTSSV